MTPWLGGSGSVLLCLISSLFLFSVYGDDLLGAFWVVSDDGTYVGQGYESFCLHAGTETGATDLVRLVEVGDVMPIGA